MIKKTSFFTLLIACFSLQASAYYEFDKKLSQSYSFILALEFDKAESLLQQEKIEKPGNDLRLLYHNYIDFLKAFISEEQQEYENFKKNSSQRFHELERNKDNRNSPFHLYVQSEILIQQAMVGIKFKEYINSSGSIKKSFTLIKKNEDLFPTFMLNKKVTAFLHAVLGSVPDRYRWMVKLAGMEGSVVQGTEELQKLYEILNGSVFNSYRPEILFNLGFIYSNFSRNEDSLQLLNQMELMYESSPLIAFVYSNILMKQGNNERAFEVLNASIENHSQYTFFFLYYKRGMTRLRKMDSTSKYDFEYFLLHYKGLNNIKSAHQKLAWIALLNGDTINYYKNLSYCRTKGNLLTEDDRLALNEAESGEVTNIYLLRSKLFFDGGYYNKALSEITGRTIDNFSHFHDQLEVTYRLGRIMQLTGQPEKAIKYFEMTLKNGMSSKYYFAANSSLMLGLIYEESNQYELAKLYFEKCLTMEYDPYKNSIDQKARAGLDRLKSIAK